MQNFTPAQLAALRQKFLELVDGAVPLESLDLNNFTSSQLYAVLGLYFLGVSQASNFATAEQGARADTALQPGGDVTGSVGGVPAGTLTADLAAALSLAQAAFGWGNHASVGYLTSAPKLKVYQATAAGAAPETFTLPAVPTAGSAILVVVAAAPKHYIATDPPPAATQFYWDGATTVKVDTVVGDLVSIYYEA